MNMYKNTCFLLKNVVWERPGTIWGVWRGPGTILDGSMDHSEAFLKGFGAHFRRDFELKNGPVFDIVFVMVFHPKMGLKHGEKITKIYEKGIPKTDPQKDQQKKTSFSLNLAIVGSWKTMKNQWFLMVFKVLAFSRLFPSEGSKSINKNIRNGVRIHIKAIKKVVGKTIRKNMLVLT